MTTDSRLPLTFWTKCPDSREQQLGYHTEGCGFRQLRAEAPRYRLPRYTRQRRWGHTRPAEGCRRYRARGMPRPNHRSARTRAYEARLGLPRELPCERLLWHPPCSQGRTWRKLITSPHRYCGLRACPPSAAGHFPSPNGLRHPQSDSERKIFSFPRHLHTAPLQSQKQRPKGRSIQHPRKIPL